VLTENDAELKGEVVRLVAESILSPDHLVASSLCLGLEAKVACGKAYGYLKTNYRDEDYINKCECFHSRMVEYMN
jgi:hypothetical protein